MIDKEDKVQISAQVLLCGLVKFVPKGRNKYHQPCTKSSAQPIFQFTVTYLEFITMRVPSQHLDAMKSSNGL